MVGRWSHFIPFLIARRWEVESLMVKSCGHLSLLSQLANFMYVWLGQHTLAAWQWHGQCHQPKQCNGGQHQANSTNCNFQNENYFTRGCTLGAGKIDQICPRSGRTWNLPTQSGWFLGQKSILWPLQSFDKPIATPHRNMKEVLFCQVWCDEMTIQSSKFKKTAWFWFPVIEITDYHWLVDVNPKSFFWSLQSFDKSIATPFGNMWKVPLLK